MAAYLCVCLGDYVWFLDVQQVFILSYYTYLSIYTRYLHLEHCYYKCLVKQWMGRAGCNLGIKQLLYKI